MLKLDYTESALKTGEGTGLRSSNPYVTLVCGKEANGTVTWITEPPFYSGFSGNDQYFMYGIVDIDALCDGYHIPRSCLTGLTVTLYGSSDSTYQVWTNSALSYVGQSTSVSLAYPVDMLRIMDMGYSDFIVSHAASAGLIGFMNGCSIELSYQTTNISYATSADPESQASYKISIFIFRAAIQFPWDSCLQLC